MTSIVTSLNLLGRKVMNDHPNINFGGCCVYAAILGECLEKMGYKVHGRVERPVWSGFVDIEKVRNQIKNPADTNEWNNNGVIFHHVFLYIDTGMGAFHHDAQNTKKSEKPFVNAMYTGHLLVDEMKMLAEDASGWNSQFPRRQIPKLRDTIQNHMIHAYDHSISFKERVLQRFKF